MPKRGLKGSKKYLISIRKGARKKNRQNYAFTQKKIVHSKSSNKKIKKNMM
uniref:hypothetical protein n=1 Tax=Carnobacterium maltaromaticum TaxID=2751 RepID=UPI00344B5CDD